MEYLIGQSTESKEILYATYHMNPLNIYHLFSITFNKFFFSFLSYFFKHIKLTKNYLSFFSTPFSI